MTKDEQQMMCNTLHMGRVKLLSEIICGHLCTAMSWLEIATDDETMEHYKPIVGNLCEQIDTLLDEMSLKIAWGMNEKKTKSSV